MFRITTFILLLITIPAFAQSPFTGSIRVRAENWHWFETAGGDDDYTFLGAQLRVAAKKKLGSVEGQLEIEAPGLVYLPDNAALAAPRGQLGLGGAYFQANGDTDAVALFVKQAFVRAGRFRIGRFEFMEGTERIPADATLAAIRRERVAHRLIGNFGFSHVGRSLDGVQLDAGAWTFLAARPTTGVFDVHGGGSVDEVEVFYASWIRSSSTADGRVFAIGYRDDRGLVKTDNRTAAARNADRESIEIGTIGGHYIAKLGNADAVAWGAYQWGDWGVLSHRAYAFDVEGGMRFSKANLRAGWFRSSGDDNRDDADHGTFFQLLPTPRVYARFPFYNAMNSDDLFLQVSAKPHAKVSLTSELHRLTLSDDADLWYAGGGAFDNRGFGFAGRPSSGNDDLATVLDVSADFKLTATMNVTVYAARAFGGDVVSAIFDGDVGTFGYVEILKRF